MSVNQSASVQRLFRDLEAVMREAEEIERAKSDDRYASDVDWLVSQVRSLAAELTELRGRVKQMQLQLAWYEADRREDDGCTNGVACMHSPTEEVPPHGLCENHRGSSTKEPKDGES